MYDQRTFDDSSRTLRARNAGPVVIPLVILLAVFLYVVVQPGGDRPAGRAISSYGFDLMPCLVPRDRLIGTDAGKGGTPPLDDPETIAAAAVADGMRLQGIHRLVPSDRVIGVALGDDARAYPLWVMEAHEVCNDTVGGRPIAVTYNPLCDSVVVFDRSTAGEPRRFGASGILFNSNLVMYDRRPGGEGESLWSQLQFRAIAGPAAAAREELTVLPCALVRWETWRERHPETRVALPDPKRRKAYRPNAFARYFADESLRYEVDPLPTDRSRPLKSRIVALNEGDRWTVFSAEEFGGGAGAGDRPTVYSFWFAWYAVRYELDHAMEAPVPSP